MLKLSQTSLKDLERDDGCPVKWKAKWIDKEIEFKASEVMNMGIYFETQVIGSGVGGKKLDDLPRLKSGKKSTDHQRIDKQVERVKSMLFDSSHPDFLGLEVIESQIDIDIGGERGGLDIYCRDIELNCPAIVDLKLTTKMKGFGEYDWSNPQLMNLTQQPFYERLYRKKNEYVGKIVNYLIVADFSKELNIKVIKVVVSEDELDRIEYRLTEARKVIEHYEKEGWSYYPSVKECEDCLLKCEKRMNFKPVEYEQVNL